ncbi:MAG: TrbC/VirB2 family protein [Candidatus Andersenbacteria bacterium]
MSYIIFTQASLQRGLEAAKMAALGGGLKTDASAVQIVQNVINFLLALMGVIAVLFLVIAGIMYITSFGDDAKAARAKKMILYVIIGLALIILSAVIVNTVLTLAQ